MYLQAKGRYSRQSHVAIPEGLHEEEFGRNGFFGPVSQLYHQYPPTGWTRIEGPLRPQAFDTARLSPPTHTHGFADRVCLLYNADVSVWAVQPSATQESYSRNADGDEVFFIHQGQGMLESDFGTLPYETGDYLILPRGSTYRFVLDPTPQWFLLFESASPIREPDRGMLGQQALYDATVIQTPEPPQSVPAGQPGQEWAVRIKRLGECTSVYYPFCPLDVLGWKGDLMVWKLNIRDIRPVLSHRMHLPPSVHTTFLGRDFVICTFLPRPLEEDPEAVRVPFYHRNIDFDEVLFYHDGDFFSRDGIQPGMITLHPQGIHHGPHPKAITASLKKTHTDEKAVMLDTRHPLHVTEAAQAIACPDYWRSWQEHDGFSSSAAGEPTGKNSPSPTEEREGGGTTPSTWPSPKSPETFFQQKHGIVENCGATSPSPTREGVRGRGINPSKRKTSGEKG